MVTTKKTEDLEFETMKSETTAKNSTLSKEAAKLSQEKFTHKDGEVVKEIEYQQIVEDDSKIKDEKWERNKKEDKDTNAEDRRSKSNQKRSQSKKNTELKSNRKGNNAENIKQDKINFENTAGTTKLEELEENKVEENIAMVTNKGKKDVKLIKGETNNK